MIKFIIGNNASGKTLYLDRYLDKCLNEGKEVLTNLRFGYKSEKEFNAERMDMLGEILNCNVFSVDNKMLHFDVPPKGLSDEFVKIITLLCRDCSLACIDEPEQGLEPEEVYQFTAFLNYIGDTYDELIIVTHSEVLIQTVAECEYFTPVTDETNKQVNLESVSEENKFEVID